MNYAPAQAEGAALQYDTHLDYFVADSAVDATAPTWTSDDVRVKVLTMKEPPAATFAHLLEDLYTVPGEFIACLEWQRIPNDRMRRDLQTRRRHFFNKRVSLVNYVAPDTRPEEMLVDDSAERHGQAARRRADASWRSTAISSASVRSPSSCTTKSRGRSSGRPRKRSRSWRRTTARSSRKPTTCLNAWLSVVPGNSAHNLRRLALLETNYADLSFLFTLDRGSSDECRISGARRWPSSRRGIRRRTSSICTCEDVGHTLVLGATGSGKSFLLNFLITHAQKYEPLTVIFDLGHSYRKLATLLGGQLPGAGASTARRHDQSLRARPDAREPALPACVRPGAPRRGGRLPAVRRRRPRTVRGHREPVRARSPASAGSSRSRTCCRARWPARLSKWVEGGRYADLFDHSTTRLSVQRFQVFDFEAMRAYPALLEPLLFYVLHRVTARLDDPGDRGRLKLCVMDEAWRFIQHDRLRAYVEEALKTWRKRNAAMLLATQSIDDFASADLLRTVVESCPTKLLLANPALDRAHYADSFS